MIKRKTLDEVLDLIDAAHEVENIKQLAHGSQNDNTRLGASTKLLEILGYLKNDKKTSVTGSNIQLVIEE